MKIFLTLFIIMFFMFFPIPLKFYIYYYNDCYYIKLYNFTLFNNAAFKKIKEQIKYKKNNPPIKNKKKSRFSKLFKSAEYADLKVIIHKFYNLKFKPLIIWNSVFEYSFKDAARTALSYGILSNIPSILYFFINILLKPKKYKFEVRPVFVDKLLLKFEAKSIIFISFANIIYMTFILAINFFSIIYKNKKATLKKHKE
ncbi:DUF2953 domain-containing protein [uncultured Clostridium sp.]|uniref:DUF2953 domain-containing protein n=1 Tax=uncultured Clostridium sp. TaxID=59620 RepID=UPI0025DFC9C4|nr:DUF2953 domain-containing protein [uncultured Clostridium sp.]